MTEPVRIRRELHLLAPMAGNRIFVVGTDGCTHIEHLPGGAGYEVHIGPKQLRVPEHRVEHYEQSPRPGYEQEQRDASRDLPSYVTPMGDGSYGCSACGRLAFRSVHAVKVHHGKEHGGERG